MEHIKQLDGLRGLAALLVVYSHAGQQGLVPKNTGTGQIGVMLFFILSGYLMGWLYGRRRLPLAQWADYVCRRFFRVYPLFALVVIISYLTPVYSYAVTPENLRAHLLLGAGVKVLWTIPVELKYYLAFMLLAPLVTLAKPAWARMLILLAILAFFLFGSVGGNKTDLWPYASFFLAGYCVAVGAEPFGKALPSWLHEAGFVSMMAALFLSLPAVSQHLFGFYLPLWKDPGARLALYTALLVFTLTSPRLAPLLLGNRVMRLAGLVSFSLYLCHLPVMRAVRAFVQPYLRLPVSILAVAAVSLALWALVERPSQQAGHWLGKQARACLDRPKKQAQG